MKSREWRAADWIGVCTACLLAVLTGAAFVMWIGGA